MKRSPADLFSFAEGDSKERQRRLAQCYLDGVRRRLNVIADRMEISLGVGREKRQTGLRLSTGLSLRVADDERARQSYEERTKFPYG